MNYKTKIRLTALAVTGIVFTGIPCASCNNPDERKGNYFTKEGLDGIYDATFQVNTTVTLEQKIDDDYDFEKSWYGSGTLMVDSQSGDNYIFTAEHVTPDAIYTDQKTKKIAKVTAGRMVVEGSEASVFKEDEENDLALLKVNNPLKDINGQPEKYFKGKIALYLDPEDYVIGVGFPGGNKEVFSTRVMDIADDKTYLDINMISGNSGGGVYLINQKELQLCGVVTKSDNIPSLEKVRKLFEGTPLEDEYL